MKKKSNACAVVEIGSNTVRLGVYQVQNNKLQSLDQLVYPTNLGHEVFNFGAVGFNTINELNSIISKYKIVCESYGIDDIKLVSTTAMRDAKNGDIIADRVLTQNNLKIDILPDSREKSMIYFDVISKLKEAESTYKNVVIVYVGSGSMGIAKYDGETITHSSYLPLGAVKFHDMLKSLTSQMSDYHLVVEEYLHTVFSKISFNECDCLIFTGPDMVEIAKLCGAENDNGMFTFATEDLKKLHHSIKDLTGENIAVKYSLTEENANVLLTSLSICYELLKTFKIKTEIMVSRVNLIRIIAKKALVPSFKNEYLKHIYESSLQVSMRQAQKYNCDSTHSDAVRKISILLFDKLKKVHGLDSKYRATLELASILHSCGQYINTRQRTTSSFDLIKNLDVYGLTKDEIALVAFVSSYNEFLSPDLTNSVFTSYDINQKIIIAKLVAIFRIANALDKSQKAKINITKIKLDSDMLTIRATASESAKLEEWTFEQCSGYFTEIFGLKVKLIVKSQLM